ncbi:MAG TPA: hypothetical protein VJY39_23235 [Acidisphaera sp.]|nr:hypothetical protein [Acidisphaera sp.]
MTNSDPSSFAASRPALPSVVAVTSMVGEVSTLPEASTVEPAPTRRVPTCSFAVPPPPGVFVTVECDSDISVPLSSAPAPSSTVMPDRPPLNIGFCWSAFTASMIAVSPGNGTPLLQLVGSITDDGLVSLQHEAVGEGGAFVTLDLYAEQGQMPALIKEFSKGNFVEIDGFNATAMLPTFNFLNDTTSVVLTQHSGPAQALTFAGDLVGHLRYASAGGETLLYRTS